VTIRQEMTVGRRARLPLLVGLGCVLALIAADMVFVFVRGRDGKAAHGTLTTVAVGSNPSAIAVDPESGHVFVAGADAGTVRMLDGGAGTMLRAVAVGQDPSALAVDPATRRVFVCNIDMVSVLDARSGALAATIPVGANPFGIVVDVPDGRVFTVNPIDGTVDMLDATTGTVLRRTRVGLRPVSAALDAHTRRLLVADSGGGAVSVLDARTNAVVGTVSIGAHTAAVAIDARTGRAVVGYADSEEENAGLAGPGLSVVDTGRLAVVRSLGQSQVPHGVAAIAVDERTARAFVVNHNTDAVAVLDTRTGALLRTVAVGAHPIAVAVDTRAGHVFVVNLDGHSVSVLDAASGRLQRTFAVSATPVAVAVDDATGQAFVAVSAGGTEQIPDPWRDIPGWVSRGIQRWLPFLPRPGSYTRTPPPTMVTIDESRL